jgi:hypothetical protein
MSEIFLETVFIILRRDRCNSTEFLFDHLEETKCYGDVRMKIRCEGVDSNLPCLVWGAMAASCEHHRESSVNFFNNVWGGGGLLGSEERRCYMEVVYNF